MKTSSYPYVAYQSTCKYNSSLGVFNTRGYYNVAASSPSAAMTAVALQPVSIAVAASSYVFQFYSSGVISSATCGTSLNHGVLLIGYGTDSTTNTPYWLVKNSWGTNWGEKGYFRVLRSTASGVGICGVLSMPSYPAI